MANGCIPYLQATTPEIADAECQADDDGMIDRVLDLEREVRTLEEQVRTLVAATEAQINLKIPSKHPILAWIIEHSAYILNKHGPGKDGKSPYCMLHGKESTEKTVEFGEKVLWFVPKSLRSKLDQKWRYGIFLGRSMSSDQNIIGLQGGDTTRARAMIRLVPEHRWDAARILGVRTTPLTESTRHLDAVEALPEPHDHPVADQQGPTDSSTTRRLKITLKDLQEHGFSPGCPRCGLHSQGEHRRARFHSHTEVCRQRVYDKLREAGVGKMVHADPARVQTKCAPAPAPSADAAQPVTPSERPWAPPPADDGSEFFAASSDEEDTTEIYKAANDDDGMRENTEAPKLCRCLDRELPPLRRRTAQRPR